MNDLLLWRWSTFVQVTSALVITCFFVALARAVRRVELRWWVRASLVNAGALLVANVFWVWQPSGPVVVLVRSAYLGLKVASLLLLAQAAYAFVRPRATLVPARAWAAFAVVALGSGVVVDTIPLIGVTAQGLMAVILGAAAVAVLRARDRALGWMTVGLALRALLGLVEAAAYALELVPAGHVSAGTLAAVGRFIAAHSSFDSGSEWLLALGCVLAITGRTQDELRANNAQLLDAQEGLRRLADRDPLTALANRRSIAGAFRAAQPTGATLLFFDLDGFKAINDGLGHAAGDACLVRFADALRACFRPEDALVRYAGDEFLVVAAGLGPAGAQERLDRLRALLQVPHERLPAVDFSVGVAELPAGGDPEAALRAADEAMYEGKRGRAGVGK